MNSLEQLSPEQIQTINEFLIQHHLRPFDPHFITLLGSEDFCANIKEVEEYNYRGKISPAACQQAPNTCYSLCLISNQPHSKATSLLLDSSFAPLHVCRSGV